MIVSCVLYHNKAHHKNRASLLFGVFFKNYRILDLPSGIEPAPLPSTVEQGVLTTGPLGKSLMSFLTWRWSSVICLIISSALVHLFTCGTSVSHSIFSTSILYSRPQRDTTQTPSLTVVKGALAAHFHPTPPTPHSPTPFLPPQQSFATLWPFLCRLLLEGSQNFPLLRVLGESLNKPVFWLSGSKIC